MGIIKKLLILGPYRQSLVNFFYGMGLEVIFLQDELSTEHAIQHDYILSYGYRHIIPEVLLDSLDKKIINLHISLLPWNRGADPNLWSFLEDTPKGITLHYIDKGIDTGDILIQREVVFDTEQTTLATSYNSLYKEIESLLFHHWRDIVNKKLHPQKQPNNLGSYHRLKDKEPFMHLLKEGWNTPVKNIIGRGKKK